MQICLIIVLAGVVLWLIGHAMQLCNNHLGSFAGNMKQGNLNRCNSYEDMYKRYDKKYMAKNDERWGKEYLDKYRYKTDFIAIKYVNNLEDLKKVLDVVAKEFNMSFNHIAKIWTQWADSDGDLKIHLNNMLSSDHTSIGVNYPIEEQLNKVSKMFNSPSWKKYGMTRETIKKMFDRFFELKILKGFSFTWTKENVEERAKKTWEIKKANAKRENQPWAWLMN